jgi:zinc transport system ATP-binding protein
MNAAQHVKKTVIEFENVNFSYSGNRVLENVNLVIHEKELLSVVGPNGGGKTTLLKLILALLVPSSGTVRVLGKNPVEVRQRIGYLPQTLQYDSLFPVTVRDVVSMGRLGQQKGSFSSAKDRKIVDSVLDELDVKDLAPKPFSALSGGQRQRVLIARALASEPELLLLDEPTSNVDAAIEEKFYELVKKLSARITILLVSHDLSFVSTFVPKVICVNHTVAVHPTSAISGDMIKDIYGVDIRMVRHDHLFRNEHSHE